MVFEGYATIALQKAKIKPERLDHRPKHKKGVPFFGTFQVRCVERYQVRQALGFHVFAEL
tara:strand:- start:122 stop:301 length:180 start_codon:yes stop_codon:yes gene_type:complete